MEFMKTNLLKPLIFIIQILPSVDKYSINCGVRAEYELKNILITILIRNLIDKLNLKFIRFNSLIKNKFSKI